MEKVLTFCGPHITVPDFSVHVTKNGSVHWRKNRVPVTAIIVAQNIDDSPQWFVGGTICGDNDVPDTETGIVRATGRAIQQKLEYLGKAKKRRNPSFRKTLDSFQDLEVLETLLSQYEDPRIGMCDAFKQAYPKCLITALDKDSNPSE